MIKCQSYPKSTKIYEFEQRICFCHSHNNEYHRLRKGLSCISVLKKFKLVHRIHPTLSALFHLYFPRSKCNRRSIEINEIEELLAEWTDGSKRNS